MLAELSTAAAAHGAGGAHASEPAQLTGATFPFATGVERALWAAQWAAEWAHALLELAHGWADECAAAADGLERPGGAQGGALLCRAQLGSLATHLQEAHALLLPCLEYTALSDVL